MRKAFLNPVARGSGRYFRQSNGRQRSQQRAKREAVGGGTHGAAFPEALPLAVLFISQVLCESLSLDLPQCSWNVFLVLAQGTMPPPPA